MASYTEPLGERRRVARSLEPSGLPGGVALLRGGTPGPRCRLPRLRADLRGRQSVRRRASGDVDVPRETARPCASSIRSCSPIRTTSSGSATSRRPTDDAAGAVGFDGFHIDTYGYPRTANAADGSAIDMRHAYESFLTFLRSAWTTELLSFNQVNGVPSATKLPDGPGFRYCEIWPPNDRWRHFEGLLDRTSGRAGLLGSDDDARGVDAGFARLLSARVGDRPFDRSGRGRGTTIVSTNRRPHRSDSDVARSQCSHLRR